jgi:CheY-like chemotaxis protein
LLPRVFDLFEQGQRALDRNQGGLGVGLTLVQRLVKLHGGRVEAHSAGEGLGAEFRVYLPCLPMAAAPAADTGATAVGRAKVSRRVLIVEDNDDVAETTAAMLSMAGHTLRCARDGAHGLQLAQEFEPEVVLLDVGLPQLDGYQVARRLRQLPQACDALLIALTGYGMPSDRERGRDAGFDHHLLKPADPGELMALIESWSPPTADAAQLDERKPATLYAFKRP